jgi:hypothetical protein
MYVAEIHWYMCIILRGKNFYDKYFEQSKDYRTNANLCVRESQVFMHAGSYDVSPIEVWRLWLGPGVRYFTVFRLSWIDCFLIDIN